MAVDEQRGPRKQTWIHGHGFLGVDLDEHEAVPGGAVAFGFGAEVVEEGLLELEDFLDVAAVDEGLSSGSGGVGEQDVFEFVAARRQDGGAFVDFGGIEQIEDRKVLHGEDFIHAFEAETAFLVEKIGDVGLLESGLLGQAEAREFACFDAVPEDGTQIILQDFELHRREYSTAVSHAVKGGSFPQARFGHSTLTEKIHSYRIAAKYRPPRSRDENHDEQFR